MYLYKLLKIIFQQEYVVINNQHTFLLLSTKWTILKFPDLCGI